jgi:putative transposase
VAQRDILPDVRHRTSRYLNNRAEYLHRPTRRREQQMQRFTSPKQAQRFRPSHAMIYGHFRLRRHLMTAIEYRCTRAQACRICRQDTCVQITARTRGTSCRAIKRLDESDNLTMPSGNLPD